MSYPESHSYLCAYDFEVEDEDFNWEETGESFSEWFPERAAEAFLEWRSRVEGIDPDSWCVVVLDRKTGTITRWNVETEITYTAFPVEE